MHTFCKTVFPILNTEEKKTTPTHFHLLMVCVVCLYYYFRLHSSVAVLLLQVCAGGRTSPFPAWDLGARPCRAGPRGGPEATPLSPMATPPPCLPAPGGARALREGRAQRSGDWLPRRELRPRPALIGGRASPAGSAGSKSGRGGAAGNGGRAVRRAR